MREALDYRGHTRAVVFLGLPLIGSHLAQFAIGLTDTMMLGWYDVEALAAATLGNSLWFMLFIVGAGFAWAVMPLVANHASTGDTNQVRRVTRMGLWLSAIYAVLVTIPVVFSERIFLAMGQTPDMAAAAGSYLFIVGLGMLPALATMLLKNFLAALERAQVVLWVTLAAVVLNAFLNYVLIFGHFGFPELGIEGSAMASALVHVATTVMLLIYVRRVLPEYEIMVRIWRPDWAAFRRVFRLGVPIGLTNLAEVGLFSVSAIMIGWIGTIELAAHGIAITLATATFMIHVGLSNVATVRAGQAVGREDRTALFRGGRVVTVLSVLAALATVSVFFSIPEFLVGLFIAPDDPDRAALLIIGATLLGAAAVFQLADGAQVVSLGLLRGVQDTEVPLVFAVISYWGVGMPAGYYLGFYTELGALGVWIGLVLGLGVAAILLFHRFWFRSGPRAIPEYAKEIHCSRQVTG